MTDPDLRNELQQLSVRIARLERLLDVESVDAPPGPAKAPPPAPEPPKINPTPPPAPTAAAPPVTSTTPAAQTPSLAASLRAIRDQRPAPIPARRPPLKGEKEHDRTSLELAIGGRWMAWVGALAVITGITLFIKYAYDEGWFGFISIGMRCAVAAAFGGVLLALGEVALRKVSRPASVGLFAAGIGTLYVTTLVSFRLEVLGSAALTLVLLALVAGIGIAVAVRAALLSIGVVSILAGYAAPLFVPDAGAFRAALPAYLSMILFVGLALSALRPRPFRVLRSVTFGAHAILGTLWIVNVGAAGGILEMTFMAGWWMMITGEAVYAAIRRQSSLGNPIISLLATTWFVLFGCVLLNTTTTMTAGLAGSFAGGVGVLAGAIAFQFGPGLETLRRMPENALEKLAASLWLQAGALLVIAAALQFSDYGTTVAWLILGLAGIEIGRRLPSIAADRFGLTVIALGLMRLISLDLFRGINVVGFTLGSLSVSQWAPLALGGIAVLHVAAWRLRVTGLFPRTHTPTVLISVSALLWLLAIAVEFDGLMVTTLWLAGAATLVAVGPVGRRLNYFPIGALLLAATALRWIMVDMLDRGAMDRADWIQHTPVFNVQALLGGLILAGGGLVLGIDRRWRRGLPADDRHAAAAAVRSAMGLLLLILISFELDRGVAIYESGQGLSLAERWAPGQLLSLWLTLLWGLAGVCTALFGYWQRKAMLSSIGGGVALICTGAWLGWDTLLFRMFHGPGQATAVLNVQFFVGLVMAIALGMMVRLGRYRRVENRYQSPLDPTGIFARAALTAIALLGLWLGSLEIDRFFDPDTSSLANAAMARQTGLSIYWALYGIGLVVIGFVWRAAASRYAGLALLAVTLLKVVVIDMSDVEYIYRVASFVGVGLLFVLTSIAYAKMSPRLLAAEGSDASSAGG